MKIYYFSCLLIIVALTTTVVNGQNIVVDDDETGKKFLQDGVNRIISSYRMQDGFINGIKEFSTNLFKTASYNQADNVVLSPLGIHLTLSIIETGYKDRTKKDMRDFLQIPRKDMVLKSYYNHLIDYMMNPKDIKLKFLTNLFIDKRFQIKQSYKSSININFHALGEQVDFHDSENAASVSSSWVSKMTNGEISTLLAPGNFAKDTNMIIANVPYFRAKWENTFPTNLTSIRVFRSTEKDQLVAMMTGKYFYTYGVLPAIKAKFIEIPYLNKRYMMIVILPDEIDGLDEVVRQLETINIRDIRRKGFMQYVELNLPRFKIDTTISLKSVLQKMGLNDIFTGSVNLDKISDSLNGVNDIVQKVFIDVNEMGTSVWANESRTFALPTRAPPVKFNVYHPFHFKIIKSKKRKDGITIFTGNIKSI